MRRQPSDGANKIRIRIRIATLFGHPMFGYNTSLSQIFIVTMKSPTNTSRSWENLINEWTTSNSVIMALNPNNDFTLVNKRRLDLAEAMVGASNAIFMKRVRYSNNTHLTTLIMDIHLVLMFHNILLPLVSMNCTNLVDSKCLLGLQLK